MLKVPHHGSANNLETDFFERITADHYVFSGDGEHGNPERETHGDAVRARGERAVRDPPHVPDRGDRQARARSTGKKSRRRKWNAARRAARSRFARTGILRHTVSRPSSPSQNLARSSRFESWIPLSRTSSTCLTRWGIDAIALFQSFTTTEMRRFFGSAGSCAFSSFWSANPRTSTTCDASMPYSCSSRRAALARSTESSQLP